MECTFCFKTEITKLPNGELKSYSPRHRGREVLAIACSRCTSYLVQEKRSFIPWDGDLKKPQIDPNEPLTLRRRKGA